MIFIISVLLILATIYLVAGLAFAIVFVFFGITKVDQAAHGSAPGFRLIIIPGTMVFWPLLLKKWILANKAVENKNGKPE